MAGIKKIGHVVLNVRNTNASLKFYTEALGMEVVIHNREKHAAFLTFGTQHHDIALLQVADGALPGPLPLHHIAMQIDGGVDELGALRQKLVDHSVKMERDVDHTLSKSVYFFDPDGNRLEIYCEMMGNEEATRILRKGIPMSKPLTLGSPARR